MLNVRPQLNHYDHQLVNYIKLNIFCSLSFLNYTHFKFIYHNFEIFTSKNQQVYPFFGDDDGICLISNDAQQPNSADH